MTDKSKSADPQDDESDGWGFIIQITYLYHNFALRSMIIDLNIASSAAQIFPFSFTVFFDKGL
jgi:hypothetical protein